VRSESKGEALRNTMIRLHLCDYKSSKFSFWDEMTHTKENF